jgi:hypothetical protein
VTPAQKRKLLGKLMDELVAHAPAIHYSQFRPMRTRSLATNEALIEKLASESGIRTDCSETVTLLCRLAGLRDPNGMHYDGYGNSHTMWQHLDHYPDPADALTGGIVVFGHQGYDHVAMVRRPGPDPICFSHGGEPGPVFIRLSWLAKALRPPRQMLSIASLL